MPVFLEALVAGDVPRAEALAGEIVREARRFDDPDLLAFGLLCPGKAAIARDDTGRGLRLLDEVMLGVAAGEVSPIPTGIVYCAVIESCLDAFDLRRAAERTEALNGWCLGQPDLVPYRGQCLVHRAQILQAHGVWDEAVTEAEQARLILSDPVHPALGLARPWSGRRSRQYRSSRPPTAAAGPRSTEAAPAAPPAGRACRDAALPRPTEHDGDSGRGAARPERGRTRVLIAAGLSRASPGRRTSATRPAPTRSRRPALRP